MKIKLAIVTGISIICQAATPFLVDLSYKERGYFAFGGEWVFIVFSIFCTLMLFDMFCKEYTDLRKRCKSTVKYIFNFVVKFSSKLGNNDKTAYDKTYSILEDKYL